LTRRSAELCALGAARCFSSPALSLLRYHVNLARAFMECSMLVQTSEQRALLSVRANIRENHKTREGGA